MTKVIGLTGGIASGKSTVSRYLLGKGYLVIDADAVVYELQAKGGRLYAVLLAHFGSDILGQDGELDRPKLSQKIFSSSENRELSAHLQNEIIQEELARRLEGAKKTSDVVFMDIPLLFELGYEAWCDEIWLVYVDYETQLTRLMARNAYSREEAEQRLAAQWPLVEKKALATRILDNGGNLEDLYRQLEGFLYDLRAEKRILERFAVDY